MSEDQCDDLLAELQAELSGLGEDVSTPSFAAETPYVPFSPAACPYMLCLCRAISTLDIDTVRKELMESQARERELKAQLDLLRKDPKKSKDFFGTMFKRDKLKVKGSH
jgi:hypothetical protein